LKTSFYIEKDVDRHKRTGSGSTKSSSDKIRKSKPSSLDVDDIDLAFYSHQNVDRFAALLDIWMNEVGFLEMKRQVLYAFFIFDLNMKTKFQKFDMISGLLSSQNLDHYLNEFFS
jgi:hypothetical protein